MRLENHYSYPLYGIASFIIGSLFVCLVVIHYNKFVDNTIECYKLGGCNESNINKEIIISYERDLKEKELNIRFQK